MEAKSARNARARGREGEELLLMAPGPVKVLPRILDAMSKPVIYHRSSEFAVLYEEIVNGLKEIFQTESSASDFLRLPQGMVRQWLCVLSGVLR